MATVLLVIHLMIALVLIVLVLMQRSEGGALGMGGGGGGLMSGRGVANLLTRATAVVAAIFFATSITMAILAKSSKVPTSILEGGPSTSAPAPKAKSKPQIPASAPARPGKPALPSVPQSQ